MELCTELQKRLPFIRCNFFCTYRKQRILAEQYSSNTVYTVYSIVENQTPTTSFIHGMQQNQVQNKNIPQLLFLVVPQLENVIETKIFFFSIFFSMSARILFILKICMAEYTLSMWQNIRIRTLAAETPAWLSHPPSIVSKQAGRARLNILSMRR